MNLEIMEGTIVKFNISASDVDKDALQYIWSLSNSKKSEGTTWSFNFSEDYRGINNIKCEVSDGKGGSISNEWTITVHYVDLEVIMSYNEIGWGREEATSLPICSFQVIYQVNNLGDISAENTEISASINGISISSEIIDIDSDGRYSNIVEVKVDYDGNSYVMVQALNEYSSDSKAISFSAEIDRSPLTSSICQLYITPYDPVIISKVDQIFQNKPWWDIRPDWEILTEWVKNYIEYENDTFIHNRRDYWQLPRETLQIGEGDCEDQAILLCTMLRTRGYSIDSVYVIIGYGEDTGHAWVTFRLFNFLGYEYWQYLEATTNGYFSGIGDFLAQILGYYEDNYGSGRTYFNDQKYVLP
jgi:hypothetical protein